MPPSAEPAEPAVEFTDTGVSTGIEAEDIGEAGRMPFDPEQFHGVGRRYPIDKALFEVQAVTVTGCDAGELETLHRRARILERKFKKLMDDLAFHDAISSGTGSAHKVNYRFQSMKDLFREVLSA
ncbi:hypothetical protein ACFXAE_19515 [Streptomyces sp. NPDC059454]|uniref:hypothetical protein n=1 Tax=Streptomyces sp. NPDC059454 TaxID=3346836 RepID=UPI00367B609C